MNNAQKLKDLVSEIEKNNKDAHDRVTEAAKTAQQVRQDKEAQSNR